VRVGRQIFVRTAALLASFLLAASVLARMGDAPLGAHQIVFELYIFLALLLDAVAIAGQVIVGRMLGGGDEAGAHAAAVRMIGWSVALGGVFMVALLALEPWVPRLFTDDPAVLHSARAVWVLFAVMQPLAGAVFALDGILIGASDTSYLMWSMLAASLGVFIPIALASLAFDWGIVGVWIGLDALIATRLVFLGARFAGRRWAVVGFGNLPARGDRRRRG
jgi:putative MATE family efflux protein